MHEMRDQDQLRQFSNWEFLFQSLMHEQREKERAKASQVNMDSPEDLWKVNKRKEEWTH